MRTISYRGSGTPCRRWNGAAGCDLTSMIFTTRACCARLVLFFFSSRRRHTRFDCDWSSDVCSSDLGGARGIGGRRAGARLGADRAGLGGARRAHHGRRGGGGGLRPAGRRRRDHLARDRKGGGEGKKGRFGGGRIL